MKNIDDLTCSMEKYRNW